jgi:hypothetical protein
MASNILTAAVAIKGTRALLWHSFGTDAIPLEKRERTGVAGNDPEEWRKTVLVTNEGQLYLDPTYIFGTIRDGARNVKKGRGSIQPAVASTLQVADDIVLVDRFFPTYPNGHPFDVKMAEPPPNDPKAPVFLDVRSAKNPATKARNVRYRVAASAGWTAMFHIQWDKTVVSRGEMEQAIRDAGMFAGLGDGRAIGFGRFSVETYEIGES